MEGANFKQAINNKIIIYNQHHQTLTFCLLVSSTDNLCKQFGLTSGSILSLDPDWAGRNIQPDLGPNCLQRNS